MLYSLSLSIYIYIYIHIYTYIIHIYIYIYIQREREREREREKRERERERNRLLGRRLVQQAEGGGVLRAEPVHLLGPAIISLRMCCYLMYLI